ncbi:hypothetical protein HPULCUR_009991 [Helicostylum pulchrum]|uniref:Uncharacterized protein n=1 Tax=Helicostylum pulchrum TaxID=562976 RepID=A0ABP9YC05_9FUNG
MSSKKGLIDFHLLLNFVSDIYMFLKVKKKEKLMDSRMDESIRWIVHPLDRSVQTQKGKMVVLINR